jgi:hypothetical protein
MAIVREFKKERPELTLAHRTKSLASFVGLLGLAAAHIVAVA